MHLYLLLGGFAVMIVTCGGAIRFGDQPVRLAGYACAIAWAASYLFQNKTDHSNPQYGVALVDLVLLGVLVSLAVRYRRTWLYAAGGFHLLGISTHVAYLIDRRIAAYPYITAGYIWAYLTLGALVWGTWAARRARGLAKSTGGS